MPKPRKSWRSYYDVWLQAEGRDRDDREYAASCRTCNNKWICEFAGDRKEAWSIALKHELENHAVKTQT